MSADRLRLAASKLRESAKAVPDWNWDDGNLWIVDYDPSDPSGQTAMQRPVGGADEPWASYIALMAPPVALALADWLDIHADYEDTGENARDEFLAALAVADAILGDHS